MDVRMSILDLITLLFVFQLMFNMELQCADANVRANLIRSIGMLGMILTNSAEANSQTLLKVR